MHLAINYSPAAAELVKSGKIHIDRFKVPDWEWLVDKALQLRPVSVHFTLEAGSHGLEQVDWVKVERLSQKTNTPYINLHLDARQSFYPGYAVDTKDPYEVKQVFNSILSDVMSVVQRFGAEQVIVENSPYQGIDGNTMWLCVQPAVISQLVNETGCGLLLDLSHAIITARHTGMDPKDYIAQLPVDQIKEIHFAGIHHDPAKGRWTDHLSILSEDWPCLDWAVNCIQEGKWSSPWLLAFEYGGVGEPFEWRSNPEVIAEQVPELYEHIQLLNH